MQRFCVLTCFCLGLLIALPFGLSAKDMHPACGHSVVTFDVPDAVYGTYPYMIISNGDIAGAYYPADGIAHGFLRDHNGNITKFDPPNAGGSEGTLPFSMNDFGIIAGYYTDSNDHAHGFIRDRRGNFTTVDVPGATDTAIYNINLFGTTAGIFYDTAGAGHMFLRTPLGRFTSFDVAGQFITWFNCAASCLNNFGALAGIYNDASNVYHAFLRAPSGHYITFDPPNAVQSYATAINDAEDVIGWFWDAAGTEHSYIRRLNGNVHYL